MDFALALFGAAAADPETTTSLLSVIGKVSLNVLLVLLGINALIIVHEFGHFAVARLCGVRCDKFYIWFDFWGLRFFRFRRGDTEYGLGVFPLGGYVKMLGQEDNPGELRAEMERARQQRERDLPGEEGDGAAASATGPDASGETAAQPAVRQNEEPPKHSEEELREAIYSPDSYLAKSVPRRMAIIVAGVVMNFLFAIVCATGAYLIGFEEQAPSIGNVVPGSAAWEADLKVGDRIKAIDGQKIRVFSDIRMAMVGAENGIELSVERPGNPGTEPRRLEVPMVPRKRKSDLAPMIGIGNLPTLDFALRETPIESWAKRYYDAALIESMKVPGLRLVAVDGAPVANYAGYMEAQLAQFDRPITCLFETKKDGTKDPAKGEAPPEAEGAAPATLEVVIPAIPMRELGVRFNMSPILGVLPGSDAETKGIRPGDRILAVDGDDQFDPMKLPQFLLRKLNEGRNAVELLVRQERTDPETRLATVEEKNLTVELRPERIIPSPLSTKDPLGSTALGLVWSVEPIVAGFAPDAPPAVRELPIGGKVESFKIVHSAVLLGRNSFSRQEKDGPLFYDIGEKIDMPFLLGLLLQYAQPEPSAENGKQDGEKEKTLSVRLEVSKENGERKIVDLPLLESKDWFNTDRGFLLKGETTLVRADDFGEALVLGTNKMVDSSLAVFKFLKSLFSGSVSPRALGGPILIVRAAYGFVDAGLGSYLIFLCLIGANLAVLNILPIPVLDGGHLVFLLYEGIFRRPPNEAVQVILSYLGLALILSLMVWVVALDIGCIARF